MCEGLIGLIYVCINGKKLVEYEARVFSFSNRETIKTM
jgi:hypothetical protein